MFDMSNMVELWIFSGQMLKIGVPFKQYFPHIEVEFPYKCIISSSPKRASQNSVRSFGFVCLDIF